MISYKRLPSKHVEFCEKISATFNDFYIHSSGRNREFIHNEIYNTYFLSPLEKHLSSCANSDYKFLWYNV